MIADQLQGVPRVFQPILETLIAEALRTNDETHAERILDSLDRPAIQNALHKLLNEVISPFLRDLVPKQETEPLITSEPRQEKHGASGLPSSSHTASPVVVGQAGTTSTQNPELVIDMTKFCPGLEGKFDISELETGPNLLAGALHSTAPASHQPFDPTPSPFTGYTHIDPKWLEISPASSGPATSIKDDSVAVRDGMGSLFTESTIPTTSAACNFIAPAVHKPFEGIAAQPSYFGLWTKPPELPVTQNNPRTIDHRLQHPNPNFPNMCELSQTRDNTHLRMPGNFAMGVQPFGAYSSTVPWPFSDFLNISQCSERPFTPTHEDFQWPFTPAHEVFQIEQLDRGLGKQTEDEEMTRLGLAAQNSYAIEAGQGDDLLDVGLLFPQVDST